MTPTERTLKRFREAGYTCQVVEKYCPHSRRRIDLYGFIDILAIKRGRIVGVQATSGQNVAHRIAKIKAEPRSQEWLAAGGVILVIGWRQLVQKKKDGSKSLRPKWSCRVTRLR